MATSRICSIPDCNKPHFGHGYCQSHRRRWRKYGDPLAGKTPNGEPQRFYREVVLPYEGDGCLSWPFDRSQSGYGQIKFESRTQRVSRLVCEEANGPAPTLEHQAAHSCGKGHEGCCNPRHLSWKTPVENRADRLIHGTHNRGEDHSQARLTEPQVREILSLKGRMSQRTIAKQFGVDQTTVSAIHRRRIWSWLD